LRLLQVVGLCDLRGTWDGALLTEEKTRFWLDLTNRNQIVARQTDLFAWRLKRWSGDVVGAEDPVAGKRSPVPLGILPARRHSGV